jgi:hypothetical protein
MMEPFFAENKSSFEGIESISQGFVYLNQLPLNVLIYVLSAVQGVSLIRYRLFLALLAAMWLYIQ